MSWHGRDSFLLEWMMGTTGIAMSVMCYFTIANDWETRLYTLLGQSASVKLWGSLWLSSGLMMMYSCRYNRRRGIELSAFINSALWGAVFCRSVLMMVEFPVLTVISLIYAIFSAIIYIYHLRVRHMSRVYGRFQIAHTGGN